MSDEPKEYEFPEVKVDLRRVSREAQKIQMAERLERVTRLAKRGMEPGDIARTMGISKAQVLRALERIMENIRQDFLADATKHRSRLLFKNHQLQQRAWDTLDRAEQGKLTKEQDVPVSGGTPGRPTSLTLKKSDAFEAEARLIETLRKLQEQEAKIVGLVIPEEAQPPVKIDKAVIVISDKEGAPSSGWLNAIPKLAAKQGVGILKPGVIDAEKTDG